jgi:hypothetical protein
VGRQQCQNQKRRKYFKSLGVIQDFFIFVLLKHVNHKNMTTNNKQSKRLTNQHKKSQGVVGIFGDEAKIHESSVNNATTQLFKKIQEEYPHITFRYRKSVSKK